MRWPCPNQKKRWKREKDRTYMGVYYPGEDRFVALASQEVPDLSISEADNYLVDIKTGEKKLTIKEQEHTVRLSPDGKYLVYYRDSHWYLVETSTQKSRNLTEDLKVSFADEDWDYPADVPGYRGGQWLDGSEAVLIYDKYDIWQFPTSGDEPICLTEGLGQTEKYQFRIRILDEEQSYLKSGEMVLVTAYQDLKNILHFTPSR